MKKKVLWVFVIGIIINALLAIGIVLFDVANDITGKILITTMDIFFYSVLGLCCFSIFDKGNKKILSIIGMLVITISCIYSIINIWSFKLEDLLDLKKWNISSSLIISSFVFAHICLMLLINSKDKLVNILKYSTITCIIIFEIMILLNINFEVSFPAQLSSIIFILIALGTIITPIIYNSNKEITNNNQNNQKYDKLEQLKKLLDSNAITQEEYENEKSKILNS